MKLYPNQKYFKFINAPKDKQNSYSIYNNEALYAAQRRLSNSAFRMYIYFGTYRTVPNGFYLSMKEAIHKTGISERSYYAAIKELEREGYIRKDPNSTDENTYIFIESIDETPAKIAGIPLQNLQENK